jgi:hypothetical protein
VKRTPLILFGLVAAPVAIWHFWLVPTWAIPFRLTVQVAVAGEIKSGSGVVQTLWEDEWAVPIQIASWGVRVRGEAIVVDLGSRGLLFVLLVADPKHSSFADDPTPPESSPSLVLNVFSYGESNGPGGAPKQLISEIQGRRDVVETPPTLLPMLVRFRDINDPTSIERVDPDDLAKSFGPNVRLVNATIQILPGGIWPFNWFGGGTPQWLLGAPATVGLVDRLPWLDRAQRDHMNIVGGTKVDIQRPERNINSDAFTQGL